MSYQSLALKYRPKIFADMVGQESTALALTNAMRLGREPHAVIFAGGRGIGKTTTARIYAKALNCDRGPTPEPCGICANCEAISLSHHEDVLEIDGASHNGIDEIRRVQESVMYAPQRSRFRVFLIDEVHMLSTSAFNALLKTLEEPPAHVVFLFATTELKKIPQTVIGRCQTFHLKPMTHEILMNRIAYILTKEQIPFAKEALSIIAKEGQGSMRDALTFLDQVILLGDGTVSLEALKALTSHIDPQSVIDLLERLIKQDLEGSLHLVELFAKEGGVIRDWITDLCEFARHAFVLRDLQHFHERLSHLGLLPEQMTKLQLIAKSTKPFALNRLFRSFVKCLRDLDNSRLDQCILENYIYEWCVDPGLIQLIPGNSSSTEKAAASAPRSPSPPKTAAPKIATSVQEYPDSHALPPSPKKAATAVGENPPEIPSAHGLFPARWEDFLTLWRQKKPLQSRIFEEVHPLIYSPTLIKLAVDSRSLVGRELLQESGRAKLRAHFESLFGFSGQIQAVEKSSMMQTANPLPGSIQEKKVKEKEDHIQKALKDAETHPMTTLIRDKLGANIESIQYRH